MTILLAVLTPSPTILGHVTFVVASPAGFIAISMSGYASIDCGLVIRLLMSPSGVLEIRDDLILKLEVQNWNLSNDQVHHENLVDNLFCCVTSFVFQQLMPKINNLEI